MNARKKTLKVRVKDKHAKVLIEWSKSVNTVWNYINELSSRSIKERRKYLSAFDIHPYTTGASKELGLHSSCPQVIAKEYVTRRNQFKKQRLKWRVSNKNSSKYSLGWIPINTGISSWKNGQVYHNGHYFSVWDSYGLSKYKFLSASFNEDSRGRWYFNVVVDSDESLSPGQDSIGVDLGIKEVATCSDGTKIGSGRWYRELEQKLSVAQRANKKNRVRAIHAKISNRRKDALHKFSRELVNRCGEIYIGDVSSSKLVKTNMAKSVFDAGWYMLKTMLKYKGNYAGIVVKEINESFSTQSCSKCGSISGPKGIEGIGIREWVCKECGSHHDRDVNAAKNILGRGRAPLAVGILGKNPK